MFYSILMQMIFLCCSAIQLCGETSIAILNKKKIITALKQDERVSFKIQQRYEEHFKEIDNKAEQLEAEESLLLAEPGDSEDDVSDEEKQARYFEIQQEKQQLVQSLQQLHQNIQTLCQEELDLFEMSVISKFIPTKYDIILPQYDMGMVIFANQAIDISSDVIKAYDSYRKKEFRTKAEIKELFALLSVTYLDKIKITYAPILQLDARHSIFYLDREKSMDAAARLYASKVQDSEIGKVYIKWIGEDIGYGVLAAQDIEVGDFLGEYTGLVRAIKVGERSSSAYAWLYPIEPGKNGIEMRSGLRQNLWLDAQYEGNEMRFVNHADEPNSQVVYVIDSKGVMHICYVATKKIKKDQQITVSYGKAYWSSIDRKKVNI